MEEYLLNKTPQKIEFSYETMCHTKIPASDYEFCIAIPQSKKYIGYITLIQEQPNEPTNNVNINPYYPVLIIYELNRFRKISNIYTIATVIYSFCEIVEWMNETIFYGSIVSGFFIIEDVLHYKGHSLRNAIFKEKIEIMTLILSLSDYFDYLPPFQSGNNYIGKLVLPFFFKNEEKTTIPIQLVPYPIHHIQYRCLLKLKPILNVSITRNGVIELDEQTNNKVAVSSCGKKTVTTKLYSPFVSTNTFINKNGYSFIYNKPQYKKRTIFEVMADIQYDVYLLYAYNNTIKTNEKHLFVDVAFISDYKTSIMMNSIFRNIKENVNLDYIEESDDEEEFENEKPDKYVYLNKKVNMECQFNYKFKKWMPIRIVESNVNYGKIVPISNL